MLLRAAGLALACLAACARHRRTRRPIPAASSPSSCRSRPAASPTRSRARWRSGSRNRSASRSIVENRGGAAHTIGAAAVAKSAPDGYTLLLTEGTALIPSLYKSLPYDPEKDLAPVSGLITINQGVVVNPALPVEQRRASWSRSRNRGPRD